MTMMMMMMMIMMIMTNYSGQLLTEGSHCSILPLMLFLKTTLNTLCPEIRDQNVFCNISYQNWPILMKFWTPFPE